MPKIVFQIKRIYEAPSPDDGMRILVDRLWPRGVSRESAALSDWMKDIAPSPDLRRWFGHLPERFEAFSAKYRDELATAPEKVQAEKKLLALARRGTVTLLYGAKNPAVNHAVVLKHYLEGLPKTK